MVVKSLRFLGERLEPLGFTGADTNCLLPFLRGFTVITSEKVYEAPDGPVVEAATTPQRALL